MEELAKLADAPQIEIGDNDRLLGARAHEDLAEGIADEALAVEGHLVFYPHPVHGRDEDAVRDGVRPDDGPPCLGGAVTRPVGLGADGRRVEDDLSAP